MWGGTAAYAVDVCSMISPADAAAALGVPEVNAGAGANRCIWTPKKYQAGAGELTVQIEGANDSAKMTGRGTAVGGVGDEAISTVVGTGAVLHVRKGSTWFVVSVHGVPVDKATEVEKTVAEAIARKL
jgi:hypothetical protein